jgi:hypothetical protein
MSARVVLATKPPIATRRQNPRASRIARNPRGVGVGVVVRAANDEEKDASVGLKAAWYGAEALGKVVGKDAGGDDDEDETAEGVVVVDRASAIASIREDYSQEYFVTGKGKMRSYAKDCEFSDPFVSFKGLERFKQNVGNLGGMMRDVDLKITSFEETEEGVATEWRFSCVLDLPWRPALAASGGTRHVIDEETNSVVKHIERWDVEPGKVLKQLLKPASKIPESQAEVFMTSLGAGDFVGVLGAAAPALLKVSAPVWLTSAALRGVTHTEASGVEGFFGWLLALSLAGQVAKFLRGVGIS